MATTVVNLGAGAAFLRFRQPFVTEGSNKQRLGHLSGVFQGGVIAPGGSDRIINIEADAVTGQSVFVYESTINGSRYAVTVSVEGTLVVALSALGGTTQYLAVYVNYTTAGTTVAEVRAYTEADLFTAPVPEAADVIILGKVVIPAGVGAIPAANVTFDHRKDAWKSTSKGSLPWRNVVKNGSFEEGIGETATDFNYIPGFKGEEVNGATVRVDSAAPRTGRYAMLLRTTGTTSVARLGAGNYDSTQKLSGGSIPVASGQLVDAHLWLSGTTVQTYTASTAGFRLLLKFYSSVDALSTTYQLESDPATHIGTFGYDKLQGIFAAPTDGYFTWEMEAVVDIGAGTSTFYVDDFRIFVEPQESALEEEGQIGQAVEPSLQTPRLEVLPSNSSTRTSQLEDAARLTAEQDGTHTVLTLSHADQVTADKLPRFDTPYVFKKTDQDFGQTAFGILGTETTADQDSTPHEFKLLHSYRSNQSDSTRVRVYSGTGTSPLLVTYNAYWGGGSSQVWVADDTTQRSTRLVVGGALGWEAKLNPQPATWLESEWDDYTGGFDLQGALSFDHTEDADVPLIDVIETPADFSTDYRLIFRAPAENLVPPRYVRLYIGDPAGLGKVALTVNAYWNLGDSKWYSDVSASNASILSMQQSDIRFLHKESTATAWTDAQWDVDGTTTTYFFQSSGDFVTGRDFLYRTSRSVNYVLPLAEALRVSNVPGTNEGWDYVFPAGGDPQPAPYWRSANFSTDVLLYSVRIPDDYSLTSVEILVTPAGAGTMSAALYRIEAIDMNPAVFYEGDRNTLDSVSSSGTAQQLLSLTAGHALSTGDGYYFVRITSAQQNDVVYSVRVNFEDEGPLNF